MRFNFSIIVVALFIVILVIFVASIYEMIKPQSTKSRYSFTPFPDVAPIDIPDANIGASANCTSKLVECKDPGTTIGCQDCGDTFSCESVSPGENIIINGNTIKAKDKKNYCLPKGYNNMNYGYGCNLKTGRAIWSATAKGGAPGWACEFLYPELFAGPACSTFVGCTDPSDDGQGVNIDQGKGAGKNELINLKTGAVYDIKKDDITPYDINEDGSPVYGCSCNSGKYINDKDELVADIGFKQYVKLPGDNFRCHLDPCSKYSGGEGGIPYTIPFWNSEKNRCQCNNGQDKFAYSDKKGICFSIPENACNQNFQLGRWEYSSNKEENWYGKGGCKCDDCKEDPSLEGQEGEFKTCDAVKQQCDSEYISHPGETIHNMLGVEGTPNCPEIGATCTDLCNKPGSGKDGNGVKVSLCSMPGTTTTGKCCIMSAKWKSDGKDGPCYDLKDPVTRSETLNQAHSVDGSGAAYCNCAQGVDGKNYSGRNCTKWCFDDDQKVKSNEAGMCCNPPSGFENSVGGAGWDAVQCGHHGDIGKGLAGNFMGSFSHLGHEIKKCFGSETMLKTSSGDKKIGMLSIGEDVLTWNNKNNNFEYQPILYIRKHKNINKGKMIKVVTNCGDDFILTSDHRVYVNNTTTKKIEDLNTNEKLKTMEGECFIQKQEEYIDIPLSPIVLNGNVVTSGGTIVSCWTGNDENVKFMEKLMNLTKEYFRTHTAEETGKVMHAVYEKCIENNKNTDNIPSILKELSLNNYIKYL